MKLNPDIERFPPRDRRIVGALCSGTTRLKQLANVVGMTKQSVQLRLCMMYQTLRYDGYDVADRASLVVWAYNPAAVRRKNRHEAQIRHGDMEGNKDDVRNL